ncbi:MspA family porin [Nocardia sp. CDC160]|uniref:MspA family porin n=1 Tax=Nocardia sp. CDC160 TaxID=3112166 RepID=UPI002DBA3F1F|nr:MspA family porin [Nocardia sp. CDC160]MEC3913184.1 MspA family porin [Nocardia sp. CDC160]
MTIKNAIAGAVTAVGLLCGAPFGAIAHADGGLAPHEKTTVAPNGMSVTVGHRDNAARPVAPLNGMPTSREVYLDNTSYGSVEGGSGKIRTGYFVACAVDLDVSFDIKAKVGVDVTADLGVSAGLEMVTPTASVAIEPEIGAGISFDLGIKPGSITDIKLGEKEIPAGGTGYIVNRDYRLTVNGCGGPLTVQAYTIIEGTSPGADAADWVIGDRFSL